MNMEKALMKLNVCIFLTKYDELFKKTIKYGIKSVVVLKKRFDSEPVHNENYLKAKFLWC